MPPRARRGATPALLVAVLGAAACVAGCGSNGTPTTATAHTTTSAARSTATPTTGTTGAAAGARARATRRVAVRLTVPAANRGAPLDTPRTLTLPRGWTAEAWARVPGARLEAWTPQGDLLVSSPADGDVVKLTPGRRPSDPPRRTTVITGLTNPQGLAFDRLNGHEVLYVAESDAVDRYPWSGAGTPGRRTILVRDLPDTTPSGDDVHRLKNVVVGPDHTIYVDIGSSSNATPPAPTRGLPRAAVLAYHSDGRLARVWATGIRNGDGLAFAPDGTLWTAVNERDQITYPFHRSYGATAHAYGAVIPGYVADHPPDEVARLTAGRNLGWPYCDPDPDVRAGHAGSALDYGNMRFDADAQTNPGGRRLRCSKLTPVQRGLPAHSAPLGFHFLEGSRVPAPWRNGAVVAGHGSWDRQPPRPPVVYWLPWERGARTLGPATTLVGGFQNADGNRWGRLADAVPGPDGSLYVSDDTAGAIYRITPARH